MPVTVTWRSRKSRDDNVRLECTHHRDDIVQNGILWPVLPRLVGGLRESKVVLSSEILMRAVNPPRREQLLRPDNAERFAELVANEILSAIAARERHIGCLDALAPREPRD